MDIVLLEQLKERKMPKEREFKIPVKGQYEEKVVIQTVDGPVIAILKVNPEVVSIFAPDLQTAIEMAGSVIAEWSRNKRKE